jgi:hypothetical protein
MGKPGPQPTSIRVGGTAIVNAVYQACLNQFGRIDNATTGNFILLFSDGRRRFPRHSELWVRSAGTSAMITACIGKVSC